MKDIKLANQILENLDDENVNELSSALACITNEILVRPGTTYKFDTFELNVYDNGIDMMMYETGEIVVLIHTMPETYYHKGKIKRFCETVEILLAEQDELCSAIAVLLEYAIDSDTGNISTVYDYNLAVDVTRDTIDIVSFDENQNAYSVVTFYLW